MRIHKSMSLPIVAFALAAAAPAQIVYGTDAPSDDENFRLDIVAMSSAGPLFTGQECYGLADDDTNMLLYMSEEGMVFSHGYGSVLTPALAVAPVDPGNMNAIRCEALAHAGGILYGVEEFGAAGEEGIYSIDLVTGDATPVHIYTNADLDIGGLDADPSSGLFYGSSDAAAARGVTELDIMLITETIISPYPGTLSDIDGLAVNPGTEVYLIQDEPQPIDVFDLGTLMYTGQLPNAVAGARVFSAGTFSTVIADPRSMIGNAFCGPAVPNSTGASGTIAAFGSDTAADNDVTLRATNLPPNSNGFFIVSQGTFVVGQAGGGVGTLCIGSTAMGRYDQMVQNSGDGGEVAMDIDLTSTPLQPGGPVAIMAGEQWFWQYWHRDMDATGAPTSNFTDAWVIPFN